MAQDGPIRLSFDCAHEDLAAAGMACSDDNRCAIYLELSGVSSSGKKLVLVGNLHGSASTLYSVLLSSDDGGATWKEAASRVGGAALDQVQLLDATHGWAGGEIQVPLPRDPFFLTTSDGASWTRKPISEDGGPGDMLKFWFDSSDQGELIVDQGRSGEGGRYAFYETRTAGDTWNIVSKTTQMPRLRRAPAVQNVDYRIGNDTKLPAYVVEKRDGEKWARLAAFLVNVASCGSPPPPPRPPPPDSPASPEPPADAK